MPTFISSKPARRETQFIIKLFVDWTQELQRTTYTGNHPKTKLVSVSRLKILDARIMTKSWIMTNNILCKSVKSFYCWKIETLMGTCYNLGQQEGRSLVGFCSPRVWQKCLSHSAELHTIDVPNNEFLGTISRVPWKSRIVKIHTVLMINIQKNFRTMLEDR